jgi:DNA-binding Lrp family transcriptional regulator
MLTDHARIDEFMDESRELDAVDLKILAAMQDSADTTNGALAERVFLSPSQVSRRRQRLEELGIIKRYRVELDHAALGLDITALVHITLAAHDRNNARLLSELVASTPHIIDAFAVTGESDYFLKIVAPSLKDLSTIINDVLLPHESVARVKSEIVLETLKESAPLPLVKKAR